MASFIPIVLFILIAGYLADCLNRKKLIVANQAVLMLSAFALGSVVVLGWASMPIGGGSRRPGDPAWRTPASM